jgi:hypothetical protein
MGITLAWVGLALAGATAAPPAQKNVAPISYTVRMVETTPVDDLLSSAREMEAKMYEGVKWMFEPSNMTSFLREESAASVQARAAAAGSASTLVPSGKVPP